MKHATLYTALLGLLAAYLIVGYIAYAMFWPVKTLVIKNFDEAHPIKIENPEPVKPGEALQYTLDYCKYVEDESVVHRTLIDGQIIFLQDTIGRLPSGCHKTLVTTAVVPETINSGRYYLDVAVTYKLNPLRTEVIHYRTDYFTVVRPGNGSTVIIKTATPEIREVQVPTPVYVPVVPPLEKAPPDNITIINAPSTSAPENKGTVERVIDVITSPLNL